MAWVTPPAFTDNTVSDHQDMLDVMTDVSWLKEHADVCGGHVFRGMTGTKTDADWHVAWTGMIFHQADKLYSSIHIKALRIGKDVKVRLLINDVEVETKTASWAEENGWVSITSPIDISSLGLTKYQWYLVQVKTDAVHSGAKYEVKIQGIYESQI